MNEYELLRVIDFLERTRRPYLQHVGPAETDPTWNILVMLIRRTVSGQLVTISSLANSAGVPYATALRRVHKLIAEGWIIKVPRTTSGKASALKPSDRLLQQFEAHARDVKVLLAHTFGWRSSDETDEDFYFGGGAAATPELPLLTARLNNASRIRFLLHDDNYFASMRDVWSDFRSNLASRRDFELTGPLARLYERLVENAAASQSSFDVVALNFPWIGEFAARGLLRPLDDMIQAETIDPADFHPEVWRGGSWRGRQYAVPIYITAEALAIRRDWFDDAGIAPPGTFADVLRAGKVLHAPAREQYGVTWNAARGMPIASAFMFAMGCCGSAILSMPRRAGAVSLDDLQGETMRPNLAGNAAARAALDYLRQLVNLSPPGVLEYDWNRSVECFIGGHAAMIYVWTMRGARFERDLHSSVKHRVDYLPHPAGPGGRAISPLGGFLLAIPANIGEDRAKMAFEAISWMASPSAMKAHAKNGFPVAPRFSVSADPEVARSSPIVQFVDRLARRDQLHGWQRPPVPEYTHIERILGEEIHDALSGAKDDAQALRAAQQRIDALMREAGYY
ncbi:extracellular solute-binding protein [Bradyrhizobium erythrophlei]|uniref:extracellular solute-binding protein n=1 Tax=Bradyrhizobium erythrophlei TaxID=1437360 RepID=UPI0035F0D200